MERDNFGWSLRISFLDQCHLCGPSIGTPGWGMALPCEISIQKVHLPYWGLRIPGGLGLNMGLPKV